LKTPSYHMSKREWQLSGERYYAFCVMQCAYSVGCVERCRLPIPVRHRGQTLMFSCGKTGSKTTALTHHRADSPARRTLRFPGDSRTTQYSFVFHFTSDDVSKQIQDFIALQVIDRTSRHCGHFGEHSFFDVGFRNHSGA